MNLVVDAVTVPSSSTDTYGTRLPETSNRIRYFFLRTDQNSILQYTDICQEITSKAYFTS
jgi:hypothetical protein